MFGTRKSWTWYPGTGPASTSRGARSTTASGIGAGSIARGGPSRDPSQFPTSRPSPGVPTFRPRRECVLLLHPAFRAQTELRTRRTPRIFRRRPPPPVSRLGRRRSRSPSCTCRRRNARAVRRIPRVDDDGSRMEYVRQSMMMARATDLCRRRRIPTFVGHVSDKRIGAPRCRRTSRPPRARPRASRAPTTRRRAPPRRAPRALARSRSWLGGRRRRRRRRRTRCAAWTAWIGAWVPRWARALARPRSAWVCRTRPFSCAWSRLRGGPSWRRDCSCRALS